MTASAGFGDGLPFDPVAALHGLAAVTPGGNAAGVDDLAFDVEAADQEAVALVLQVLEQRARVLAHEDGVRRIVVDAELVADAVLLADAMQRDPRARRVRDVVVPAIEHVPARHRALLDAVGEAARLRFLEQRNEHLLEHHEVLVHLELDVAADEAAHRIRA